MLGKRKNKIETIDQPSHESERKNRVEAEEEKLQHIKGRREAGPTSSLKRYHLYNAAGQTVRFQST